MGELGELLERRKRQGQKERPKIGADRPRLTAPRVDNPRSIREQVLHGGKELLVGTLKFMGGAASDAARTAQMVPSTVIDVGVNAVANDKMQEAYEGQLRDWQRNRLLRHLTAEEVILAQRQALREGKGTGLGETLRRVVPTLYGAGESVRGTAERAYEMAPPGSALHAVRVARGEPVLKDPRETKAWAHYKEASDQGQIVNAILEDAGNIAIVAGGVAGGAGRLARGARTKAVTAAEAAEATRLQTTPFEVGRSGPASTSRVANAAAEAAEAKAAKARKTAETLEGIADTAHRIATFGEKVEAAPAAIWTGPAKLGLRAAKPVGRRIMQTERAQAFAAAARAKTAGPRARFGEWRAGRDMVEEYASELEDRTTEPITQRVSQMRTAGHAAEAILGEEQTTKRLFRTKTETVAQPDMEIASSILDDESIIASVQGLEQAIPEVQRAAELSTGEQLSEDQVRDMLIEQTWEGSVTPEAYRIAADYLYGTLDPALAKKLDTVRGVLPEQESGENEAELRRQLDETDEADPEVIAKHQGDLKRQLRNPRRFRYLTGKGAVDPLEENAVKERLEQEGTEPIGRYVEEATARASKRVGQAAEEVARLEPRYERLKAREKMDAEEYEDLAGTAKAQYDRFLAMADEIIEEDEARAYEMAYGRRKVRPRTREQLRSDLAGQLLKGRRLREGSPAREHIEDLERGETLPDSEARGEMQAREWVEQFLDPEAREYGEANREAAEARIMENGLETVILRVDPDTLEVSVDNPDVLAAAKAMGIEAVPTEMRAMGGGGGVRSDALRLRSEHTVPPRARTSEVFQGMPREPREGWRMGAYPMRNPQLNLPTPRVTAPVENQAALRERREAAELAAQGYEGTAAQAERQLSDVTAAEPRPAAREVTRPAAVAARDAGVAQEQLRQATREADAVRDALRGEGPPSAPPPGPPPSPAPVAPEGPPPRAPEATREPEESPDQLAEAGEPHPPRNEEERNLERWRRKKAEQLVKDLQKAEFNLMHTLIDMVGNAAVSMPDRGTPGWEDMQHFLADAGLDPRRPGSFQVTDADAGAVDATGFKPFFVSKTSKRGLRSGAPPAEDLGWFRDGPERQRATALIRRIIEMRRSRKGVSVAQVAREGWPDSLRLDDAVIGPEDQTLLRGNLSSALAENAALPETTETGFPKQMTKADHDDTARLIEEQFERLEAMEAEGQTLDEWGNRIDFEREYALLTDEQTDLFSNVQIVSDETTVDTTQPENMTYRQLQEREWELYKEVEDLQRAKVPPEDPRWEENFAEQQRIAEAMLAYRSPEVMAAAASSDALFDPYDPDSIPKVDSFDALETGKPATFRAYHGTTVRDATKLRQGFRVGDLNRSVRTGEHDMGDGIYITDDADTATRYAVGEYEGGFATNPDESGLIAVVEVRVQNPYVLSEAEAEEGYVAYPEIADRGHDAIIMRVSGEERQAVILDPSKVSLIPEQAPASTPASEPSGALFGAEYGTQQGATIPMDIGSPDELRARAQRQEQPTLEPAPPAKEESPGQTAMPLSEPITLPPATEAQPESGVGEAPAPAAPEVDPIAQAKAAEDAAPVIPDDIAAALGIEPEGPGGGAPPEGPADTGGPAEPPYQPPSRALEELERKVLAAYTKDAIRLRRLRDAGKKATGRPEMAKLSPEGRTLYRQILAAETADRAGTVATGKMAELAGALIDRGHAFGRKAGIKAGTLEGIAKVNTNLAKQARARAARTEKSLVPLDQARAETIVNAIKWPMVAAAKEGERKGATKLAATELQRAEAKLGRAIARYEEAVAKAKASIETAPARYAGALSAVGNLRDGLMGVVAQLEDQAQAIMDAAETGDGVELSPADAMAIDALLAQANAMREVAGNLPTTLQQVVDRFELDPAHLIGGEFGRRGRVTGTGMDSQRLPRSKKSGSQRQKKRKAAAGNTGRRIRDQVLEEAARFRTETINEAALWTRDTYGKTVADFPEMVDEDGNPLKGRALYDAMEQRKLPNGHKDPYVPWQRKGLLDTVAPDAVNERTVFIPKAIYDHFNNTVAGGTTSTYLRAYDQTMRAVKTSWLALAPRWLTGNMHGNLMMAMLGAGLTPKDIAEFMPEAMRRLKAENQLLPGRAPDETLGHLDHMAGPRELPRTLFNRGFAATEADWLNPERINLNEGEPVTSYGEPEGRFRRTKKLARRSYQFNEYIDNLTRATIYLAKKNDPEGRYSEKQAIAQALKAAGDFKKLTRFERNVVRRIWLFWPWYKHITKLTLRLPLEHPARVAWVWHIAELGQPDDDDPDEELPPQYVGALRIGDTFYRLPSANPFGEVTEGPALNPTTALKTVTPALQVPIALATGFDLGRMRPFSRPPGAGGGDDGKGMKPILLGAEDTARYLARQFPQTRLGLQLIEDPSKVRYDSGDPIEVSRGGRLGGTKTLQTGRTRLSPVADFFGVPTPERPDVDEYADRRKQLRKERKKMLRRRD